MANETFTAIQTTVATPGFDADNDGVIDPGEQVTTTVTITNNSTTPTPVAATGVQFNEILDGMTIVDQPGDDINVSPIAFDDAYNVVGNTTFTVSAAERHPQRLDRHPCHPGRGRRVLQPTPSAPTRRRRPTS